MFACVRSVIKKYGNKAIKSTAAYTSNYRITIRGNSSRKRIASETSYTMFAFQRYIFTPHLYSIYNNNALEDVYQQNGLEKWSERLLIITKIGLYSTPLLCMYFYLKGHGLADALTVIGGFACLAPLSLIMRGCGRAQNPRYVEFIKQYTDATSSSVINYRVLRLYDFEFFAWPVSYEMPKLQQYPLKTWFSSFKESVLSYPSLSRQFVKLAAFIAVHTFGMRMIYPGSLTLVHTLLWNHLIDGRRTLVQGYNAERSKVVTADGNALDTMYINQIRRGSNGKTLVICCEGNAAFYEVGICYIPIKAGFSVLAWNRPGFGESTGRPYPSQEHNAIDAIMQYAINKLNFKPENIILLGWSIGGYTSAWAAANYPIKALVLDATFDSLLPLALNQMPKSLDPVVREVVYSYVNLDIANLLKKYNGPVKLIRRTHDEMICLINGDIRTNRANHLLLSLLEHRHTDFFEDEEAKEMFSLYVSKSDTQREGLMEGNISQKSKKLLQLISKYMSEYRSTHCTPLPEEKFLDVLRSMIDVSEP